MPPKYEHKDIDYFRPGMCQTCGEPTYHKPITATRRSGRDETLWKCEACGAEVHVLERIENEFELLSEYIMRTFFPKS